MSDSDTLKVVDPLQGNPSAASASLTCPINDYPLDGRQDRAAVVYFGPSCTLCLCPFTVKHKSHHLLDAPSSSLPSFLTSSAPSHCFHRCGSSCSALGKFGGGGGGETPGSGSSVPVGTTMMHPDLRNPLACGLHTPVGGHPPRQAPLFSVRCVKLCGITLTGGT